MKIIYSGDTPAAVVLEGGEENGEIDVVAKALSVYLSTGVDPVNSRQGQMAFRLYSEITAPAPK